MEKRKKVSYAKYGYIFSIPFVVAFLIFTLYPVIYTVVLGFTDLKGAKATDWHFLPAVGKDLFANFTKVLGEKNFKNALSGTITMWVFNFIPQIVLALVLAAWFTNSSRKIKGQGFFKVVFYMPNIITATTVAVLFASLFQYPKGPINDLVQFFGNDKIDFFMNKTFSRGLVSFIQFWQWYGYTMIILVSGILGINPEIYKAADIDGATNVQKFFRITLPNLRTVLIYTLVTSLIGGLQMFDIPLNLVQNSGPDNATVTASVYIYNQAFKGKYLYNKAAAASMIMFVLISILSAVIFYLMRDRYEVKEQKEIKKAQKAMKKAAKLKAKGGTA